LGEVGIVYLVKKDSTIAVPCQILAYAWLGQKKAVDISGLPRIRERLARAKCL